MGMILFLILAGLEIVLACKGRGAEKSKKRWLKNRLLVRGAELLIVLGALLLPYGQKWRLMPALIALAILLLAALVKWLVRRGKEDRPQKTGSAVASCVLSILLIGLLLVPAFVFTGYKGLPVSGSHEIGQAAAILVDSTRTDSFEQDGSFCEVPVHFYYPADAAAGERFPLVIFSHGAFGYYQSNVSTYLELASNGYVVAALDHPHHAFFTRDSAGQTVLVDMDFFNTALTLDSETDAAQLYALYTQWMALRTADMNFVVDSLEAAGEAGALDDAWCLTESGEDELLSILAHTDLTKIGLMGHSMGGATAVQLGRERSDIAAVIDIDGTMLGEYRGVEDGQLLICEEPYPLPVLEFCNWEAYNSNQEYLAQDYPYPNLEVIAHGAAAYSVTVRDTLHMDFTDLPLLSPSLGKLLGSGERSSEETMTIVNRLVLGFFNQYLKGEGAFSVQEIY